MLVMETNTQKLRPSTTDRLLDKVMKRRAVVDHALTALDQAIDDLRLHLESGLDGPRFYSVLECASMLNVQSDGAAHDRLRPARKALLGPGTVTGVRKVVLRVRRRRDGGHAPVDPDGLVRGGRDWLGRGDVDDERDVLVPERVTRDPHGPRLARQLTRQDQPQPDTAGEHEDGAVEAEPARRVVECRPGPVTLLEPRQSPALRRAHALVHPVFEGLCARRGEVPDGLLLGHGRPGRQPVMLRAPGGELFVLVGVPEGRQVFLTGPVRQGDAVVQVTVLGISDQGVPHPPAAVPLSLESSPSGCGHPGPVRVPTLRDASRTAHDRHYTRCCSILLMETRSNNNVVYQCAYHVVWCPKWRRPVITSDDPAVDNPPVDGDPGPVDTRLVELIRQVCDERDAQVIELETMPDHVHLLVSVDPQYGIHRLVKQIKGRSSKLLRDEYPSLKRRIPTLWTNSYFVATTGGAPLEAIKKYVANQRNS